MPCHSGRAKGIRGLSSNLRGVLVAPVRPDCVYFGAVKGWRPRLFRVPLADVEVKEESRFLSEDVVVTAKGLKAVFRFARGQGRLAEAVAEGIRDLLKRRPEPVVLGQSPLPDSLQATPMESESAPATAPERSPEPLSESVPQPEESLAPAEPLPALGDESPASSAEAGESPIIGEAPLSESSPEPAPEAGLGDPRKHAPESGDGLPPLPVIGSK